MPFNVVAWRSHVWLLLLVALLSSHEARAWSGEGHRLIATAARAQLSEAVRNELDRLLATEPGSTIESASIWADDNRTPVTARWHYVNLPVGDCVYAVARDCPDGQCVVEQIDRQRQALQTADTDAARLRALRYLVHLVADLHQPLHAGRRDDKGGNLFQVQAFGRGSNLHAVWDVALIEQSGHRDTLPNLSAGNLDPAEWATESCRIVAQEGFYPARRRVDAAYLARWDGTLEERLGLAAARLAALLERSLVPNR